MALILAKWRRGYDSSLENTELTNGTIYVSKDTGRLHIDIDDARIEITDFVKTTESEILNTLSPLPKFYYATDTYRLWYYDNAEGWCCLSAGTAEKIEADLDPTTKAYLVGLTESGTKPIYDSDVYLGVPEGSIYATTFNGYTLAPASTKDYIDNSTPTALRDDNTNLITERTAYHGLPSINDSHEYTSDTNIYAPTEAGTEGYVLASNEEGIPEWVESAPSAEKDSEGNVISDTYATIIYVDELIGNLVSFEVEVVDELPAEGKQGVIYLMKSNDEEENNYYIEYIWVPSTSSYEKIGSTDIDLSNYVTLNTKQSLENKTYEGYNLGEACSKEVIDNTSPVAVTSEGENLVTERTVYNTLPTVNYTHDYDANSTFFAPVLPGGEGQILVAGDDGIPVWEDRSTLESTNNVIFYGVSSDESTTEKHVSISNFENNFGIMLIVTFETECDAGATINVSNTGAIPIYHMGSALRNNMIQAGATATFIYNSDHYLLLGTDTEAGSDYNEVSLVNTTSVQPDDVEAQPMSDTETLAEISSSLYATSTDTSTTEKTANITDYVLGTGSIAVVTFETRVDEGATLNISGTGARYIIHMGDTLRNNMIQAGATAMFVYTGSQYLLLMTDTEAGSDYLESGGGEGDTPEPEKVAYLQTGTKINVAFKELAGDNGAGYTDSDSNIKSITKSDELDESASYVDIALEDSEYPVYAWYDSNNGIIYYWTEAEKIYMNENSSYMFFGCSGLTSLDVSNFDTSNVIYTNYMFYDCSGLTSLDVSNFDTSNVIEMLYMFGNCSGLTSLDITNWDTSNVTNMSYMFLGCSGLTSLDVSNFDTSKVTEISYMFSRCSGLTSLDVSNFDTSNVIYTNNMFVGCSGLVTVYSNDDKFITDKVTLGSDMFTNCTKLVGGNGTVYDSSKVDYTMAHIDTADNPGYFTAVPTTPFAVYSDDDDSLTFYDDKEVPEVGTDYNDKTVSAVYTGFENEVYETIDDEPYVNTPWADHAQDITAVVFDSSFSKAKPISTALWFFNFSKLISITGLEYLNTSNVTTMNNMFANCTALASLDLSSLDTSNVTNMVGMFSYCTSLTSLDLTGFNTSKVTDASGMFYHCESLTSLSGVSDFDASSMVSFEGMFCSCKFDSIDLSNWNTDNVNTMASMFNECTGLSALDLSSWNTSNVTDMSNMFYDCSNLEDLNISTFNTTNVTDMSYMFYGCTSLASLDVSNWDTGSVITMNSIFRRCSTLSSIDLSNWNTSNVTNMYYMFAECTILATLNVASWDTSKVTEMTSMFRDCSSLSTIYSHDENFVTTSVKYGSDMFYGCSSLVGGNGTEYDMSKVDYTMAHVDSEENPGYFVQAAIISLAIYDENDQSLTFYSDVKVPSEGDTYKGHTVTKAYTEFENEEYEEINGYPYTNTPWADKSENILSIIFDESFKNIRPMYTACWFNNFYLSTTIDCKYLDTSEVTDMSYMFHYCTSLESLDVSNWDTANVTDMSYMFANCTALVSLNVSSFNTSNVTIMSYMFNGCTSLESLDVSNWDTSKVTDMQQMFYNCYALTSLDVSNWETSKVTNMSNMFSGCTSLASLDVSNWETSKVTTMEQMFYDCSGLTYLNVSNWNTANVTDMSYMFANCTSLASLDVSNWDTSKVTDMDSMFSGCSTLTSLNVSNWNTSNVTIMSHMFDGCSALTSLNISNLNTSKVTDMCYMFYNCIGITTIYSNDDNFVTDKLSSPLSKNYMFTNCTSLVGGNGTTYDSSKVTSDMAHVDTAENPGYFSDPITQLDTGAKVNVELKLMLGDGDASSVTAETSDNTVTSIEYYDGDIEDIDFGKNYTTISNIDSEYPVYAWIAKNNEEDEDDANGGTTVYIWSEADKIYMNPDCSEMFEGFSSLEELNITHFDTSKVTNMNWMFRNCYALESIDLDFFDTSKVTTMSGMFDECDNLLALDLDSLDTSNVTTMSSMFRRCIKLTTIDIAELNTSKVTNMDQMFYGDSALATIYSNDDNFVTNNVTSSTMMFYGCDKLTGGNGTAYSSGKTDASMAHIDTDSNPGYFKKMTGAHLRDGYYVNETFKKLAGAANPSYTTIVSYIKAIEYYDGTPTINDSMSIISVSDSEYPVYAWYDNNGTIYIWSEADKIYMNEDSSYMFGYLSGLTSLDVSNLDTGNVITMNSIFRYCTSLISLDVSNFNTSNVTDMHYMFSSCMSLTSLDVSNFNTSNVTDMHYMFYHCYVLTSLDVSNWDISKVTTMEQMFGYCKALTTLDLGGFTTSNLTASNGMFRECDELTTINLGSNFDTSKVTAMNAMFRDSTKLTTIYANDFSTASMTNDANMFLSCTSLVGGNGTKFDSSKFTSSMAHIDTSSNPGYFTDPSKYVAG